MATMNTATVSTILVSKNGVMYRFTLNANGEPIRCQSGPNQVDLRTCAINQDVFFTVKNKTGLVQKSEGYWTGEGVEVFEDRPTQRLLIRRADGSIYQIHPTYAYSFAAEQLAKLQRRETKEAG